MGLTPELLASEEVTPFGVVVVFGFGLTGFGFAPLAFGATVVELPPRAVGPTVVGVGVADVPALPALAVVLPVLAVLELPALPVLAVVLPVLAVVEVPTFPAPAVVLLVLAVDAALGMTVFGLGPDGDTAFGATPLCPPAVGLMPALGAIVPIPIPALAPIPPEFGLLVIVVGSVLRAR